MGLVKCPDCGTEISDVAETCVKCGRPMGPRGLGDNGKIIKGGAWCPNCGNKDSFKKTQAGCFYWFVVVILCLLPLFLYPFLPRIWNCRVCLHQWRA